jgi:hypothetical protein
MRRVGHLKVHNRQRSGCKQCGGTGQASACKTEADAGASNAAAQDKHLRAKLKQMRVQAMRRTQDKHLLAKPQKLRVQATRRPEHCAHNMYLYTPFISSSPHGGRVALAGLQTCRADWKFAGSRDQLPLVALQRCLTSSPGSSLEHPSLPLAFAFLKCFFFTVLALLRHSSREAIISESSKTVKNGFGSKTDVKNERCNVK